MNVLIIAVCVNLLILANVMCTSHHNINLDTIMKILKHKPRKSGNSINDDTNDSVEVMPIIPGFYLEKPKDLPQSLFKSPKPSADDIFEILSKEEKARSNKTKLNAKTENKSSEEDYLQGQIIKAINDLNNYRAKQKSIKEELNKTKAYKECDDDLIDKKHNIQQSYNVDSGNAQKRPVKKLLGRVFQGIESGIDYTGIAKKKKPKYENSNNNQVLIELLKKIFGGNLHNTKHREGDRANRHEKPEEEIQRRDDVLGNILSAIRNKNQGSESEIQQRSPSVVILSPEFYNDDVTEEENTAKESMEISDDDSSDNQLYNTRRNAEVDIGSKKRSDSLTSTEESGSSDYERNPGNPFTIHKNKYKQNWPYNHFMDGDHMNINPFGPQFGSLGPTGPELFFGRKWWYFNQDDYKPMG